MSHVCLHDSYVTSGRGVLQSQSHDCLVGSHEGMFLFAPSCCGECFYYL